MEFPTLITWSYTSLYVNHLYLPAYTVTKREFKSVKSEKWSTNVNKNSRTQNSIGSQNITFPSTISRRPSIGLVGYFSTDNL